MSETVTIILPLPPSVLNPNGSHGSWYKRAAALKKCRRLARVAIEAEHIETGPWGKVEVQAKFCHKQKRRRDGANHNAMLKGYIDGIVDAQLISDDHAGILTLLPPDFCPVRDLTRVELTITRVE